MEIFYLAQQNKLWINNKLIKILQEKMAVVVFWYLNYMILGVSGSMGVAAPIKNKAVYLAPS